MLDGIAAAAIEQDPTASATVDASRARRLARLAQTRLRVGHLDLPALP